MRNKRAIIFSVLLGFLPFTGFAETPTKESQGAYDVCAEIKCDNVKNYLNQLQTAVKTNNKAAAANLMTYPLRINEMKNGKVIHRKIKNEKEFIRQYDSLLTDAIKKSILKSTVKDSISNYQGIGIVDGKLWLVNDVLPIHAFVINIENRESN